jgi:2-keto-4-pentenoate hydratase
VPDTEEAAAILGRARLARSTVEALPVSCRPTDELEAYGVQEALADWLDRAGQGAMAGYKIGCTTPVMQRYMEIDQPAYGRIRTQHVHGSGVVLTRDQFVRPGVECEIAVRLGRPLAPEDAPFDRDGVAERIEACMAAIEVVDDRYRNFRRLGTPTLIADDFFQAACILAEPVMEWRQLDLAAARGETVIDGTQRGEGRGADVMGHPFNAVAWLANALAERGMGLKAGDLVLTGSVVQTQWIDASPSVIRTAIGGLGAVELEFL